MVCATLAEPAFSRRRVSRTTVESLEYRPAIEAGVRDNFTSRYTSEAYIRVPCLASPVAEKREENKHRNKENIPYGKYGGCHKAVKMDSTITTTLKNFGAFYQRQGKCEAVKTLEDCAMRSQRERMITWLYIGATNGL
ncbi:uncharacterized protein [Temnothorax longispinosus]|uniref:uncharacterized protein n=1 Tax=Temnothorax longispinosus TaxID=300112 RepID=UPI003A99BD54